MTADQDDAEDQYTLGCEKLTSGRDSPEDYAEAAKWFSKAAEQGHAKAQNQLGYMYFIGQGVPKDYAKAVQWCRKSADQGSSMAQSQLGYMYANGLGLVRDDAEAVRWYRLAAEQGREASQYNLGVMYSAGRGVTQDYKEAVKWYRLAADQGYAGAQHSLALMYEKGQGVAQDNTEAEIWYRKLAEQGDADAQAALKRLGVGLTGFFKRLAQYYAEFLSTDFKKQRLPRRRLENSDAKGRLVGIPLRKYAGFQQKLWEELAKPIGTGLSLTITRGSWRSALPKAIMEAIATHIDQVKQLDIDSVVNRALARARRLTESQAGDPEIAFEQFVEETRASIAREIIAPFLDRMEDFFSRTEHKPVESLRELEDQLSTRLANSIEAASGAAFSTLFVEGKSESLEALLRDQLALDLVRSELETFFATFSAADLYVDLSDLVRSSRLIENADFYLHIGEVHHDKQVYPIFYIPFTVERTERSLKINSEPRLYVNKRAMDYVAQQVASAERHATVPSMIRERIFYLSPEQSALGVAQKLLDDMAGTFNLRADINLHEPRDQKVSSLLVTATNRLSFSLFDRSDESMVNDYEAMLVGLEAGGDVVAFFKALIDDFLLKNPIVVRDDIDDGWEELTMPQRLVFDSPLPLVEEQRKILSAIRHPQSRFIAVEGPPGTGKSHTITAVAFNTILSGQSLLVLSDKKEALDVVEDKLNQALAKVRPSEDFVNPILRLGKGASNYAQLMKKSAIERLQVNQRVVRQRRSERELALKNESAALINGLQKSAEAYAAIDMAEIAGIERETKQLTDQTPVVKDLLEDAHLSALIEDYGIVAAYIRSQDALATILRWQGAYPARLNELARIAAGLAALELGPSDIAPLRSFSLEKLRSFTSLIDKISESALPVFGHLFAGKKLLAISHALRDECGIICNQPGREEAHLRLLRNRLLDVRNHLKTLGIESEFEVAIALISAGLAETNKKALAPPHVLEAARRLDESMNHSAALLMPAKGRFYSIMLDGVTGPMGLVDRIGALKAREARVRGRFEAVPEVDYLGAKTRIESLNTQALAERIDERLIEFYNQKRNDALTLGKIIREKQRFPLDKFADIQRAFPCIIAGLRDYAEFIPLKREIFDLVIIDEASQVSIAQALPAIIRAKKVLVLGDRNQFSNVKTTNASREVNTAYMNDLIKAFDNDFPRVGAEVRTKIDLFDIRSSVLDFIEPISNFSIQLKKHFRSYPEMIGFSSKYFYNDSLQVMKIRGKSVEEVIEFDAINHDGLIDQRNVNNPEAQRIVDRIVELLDHDQLQTVGVITPHTEQQAHIANLIQQHPRSEEIYDKLRLKVMTFDTCQGEEREIIFYSLVASAEKDRLAYIFPRELDRDRSGEIDHNLRLQRLNVGFSRGQEKIVFVHSKPIDEYSSALRTALVHYRGELERAKAMPTEDDVDQASPMEKKVLHWLSQVPLLRELGPACEIVAGFELGNYLKQLDPTYSHPKYRIDFLLRIEDGDRMHQLALEYDGFEFHFAKDMPAGLIDSSTWSSYLNSSDLEREHVIESFGVQMIRLNRFNLGNDPVATIDKLLRERLDDAFEDRKPHDLVTETTKKAEEIEQGLKSGDYKRCKKCNRDLPIQMFSDANAKSGKSHHCKDCKSGGSRKYGGPRFRRHYRRRY